MSIIIPTIPKSFQLMGHTYKVRIVKKVDKDDSFGEVIYAKKAIRLKAPSKDTSVELVEESFFHELVHALLDETEYNKLSNDETFVERLGRALHQAFKTFKYHEAHSSKEHPPKS